MATIPKNPERERRTQDRIEGRIANRYERRLRREIARSMMAAAEAHEKGEPTDAAVRSRDAELRRHIERLYTDSWTTMGERAQEMVEAAQKSSRPHEHKQELTEHMKLLLRQFVLKWTARKVTQITSVTAARVRYQIRIGIEAGLSVDEIGKAIRDVSGQMSAWRANMIARTEVHSAANNANLTVVQESGIARRKLWIPVGDGRTRQGDNSDFNHIDVDPVPMDQPFIVSGEELQYPGDPAGSAGNIINCRCAVAYETGS